MLQRYNLISMLILIILAYNSQFALGQSIAKNNLGLNIFIITSGQDDSSPESISKKSKFISFNDITKLPHHLIQIQDHKTKKDITWKGIHLYDVLNKYLNIDWQQIDRMIVKAPDGYSSSISGIRMAETKNALCAFGIHGEGKWKKIFGYLRIIFPEMHEMHWMNNPHQIIIYVNNNSEENRSWKFHFFNTSHFQAIKKDMSNDKHYWYMSDILTRLHSPGNEFTIFSQDGHIREYIPDTVMQKMKIYIDTDSTVKISGSQVPIGFRLRKIFFISSKNNALFFKSLTSDEQQLWCTQFSKINSFFKNGTKVSSILLILNSGEKIPSKKIINYQTQKISLYQLMQMEQNERADLHEIIVTW